MKQSKIKFHNKEYHSKDVIKNLLKWYNESTASERISYWYKDANAFCNELASTFNIPLLNVCGIVAALSPQKNWQENQKIAYQFFKGVRGGHTKDQIKKAEACLLASSEVEIFTLLTKHGLKTSCFFINLLHIDFDTDVCTIDRHALVACIYKPHKQVTIDTPMNKTSYHFFMGCYNIAARKLGILPHDFQAIIWHVVRRFKELPKSYNVNDKPPF